MTTLGAQVVVLLLGFTILLLSAWGMTSPGSLVSMVTQTMNRSYGMYVAVLVRLLLGVALITAAPISQFPMVFQVIGWIAITAAVVIFAIGRVRLRNLVAWIERFSASAIRVWLLFGMAFGGFLIYGLL